MTHKRTESHTLVVVKSLLRLKIVYDQNTTNRYYHGLWKLQDLTTPDQDGTISNHDSNHCDIFTDCVHHSKCPHYLEQSEKLKTVALDTSEYTRIRGELRQLICNQKERKVCCEPSTFSSNSGRPSPRPSAGNWSGWTVCTVSCGGGTQERRRSDGQIQMQRCNSNPCLNSGKVVE